MWDRILSGLLDLLDVGSCKWPAREGCLSCGGDRDPVCIALNHMFGLLHNVKHPALVSSSQLHASCGNEGGMSKNIYAYLVF